MSAKESKGRFLKPDKLQNHTNEGKKKKKGKKRQRGGRKKEKRKSNGYTPSFYTGYFKDSFWPKKKNKRLDEKKNGSFGDNIVKNPARRLYGMSSIDARWPETSFTTSKWHTLKDWQDSWKHINPLFAKKRKNNLWKFAVI